MENINAVLLSEKLTPEVAEEISPHCEFISRGDSSAGNCCPDCGIRLVRLGHCFTCPACGWGGCS